MRMISTGAIVESASELIDAACNPNAAPADALTIASLGWSREDSKAAVADGWDVFAHDVRGLEIERLDDPEEADDPPRFPDDAAAIWHVYNMARGGSALHQKALYVTLLAMNGFRQTYGSVPLPEADAAINERIDAFDAYGTHRTSPAPAPASVHPGEVERLRDLCARAGITVCQAQEDEIKGRWDWIDENRNASDMSFDTEQDAALAALDEMFGEDWRHDVDVANTRRSFLDYVESAVEQREDEKRMGP